jgi:hypothetical protein
MRANVSGQRRKSTDDLRFISIINKARAESHECGRTNEFALSRRKQGFDSPRERQDSMTYLDIPPLPTASTNCKPGIGEVHTSKVRRNLRVC